MDALRSESGPLAEFLERTRTLLEATAVAVLDAGGRPRLWVGDWAQASAHRLEVPLADDMYLAAGWAEAERRPPSARIALETTAAYLPLLRDLQDPEEALEAFRALVDASPFVAWVKDRNGRLSFASRAFERIMGVGPGGLLGRLEDEVGPPHLAELVRHTDRQVMATGVPMKSEHVVPSPDGQVRTWLSHKFPLPAGRGIGGVAVDVTEVRRQEVALARIERRFEALTLEAPVGIFEVDLEGDCAFVNRHFQSLTGLSTEQCLGRGWKSAVHPDDLPGLRAVLQDGRQHRRQVTRRFRLRRGDGELRWVDAVVTPVEEGIDGASVGFIGTMVDVTAEQLAIAELREAEQGFRALTEVLPLAMLVVRAGIVVYANRAATTLLGRRAPVELVGRPLDEVCAPGIGGIEGRLADDASPMQLQVTAGCGGGAKLSLQVTATRVDFDGAPSVALALVPGPVGGEG